MGAGILAAIPYLTLGIQAVGTGASIYQGVKAGEKYDEAARAAQGQAAEQTKLIGEQKTKQDEYNKQQADIQNRDSMSQQRRQQRALSGAPRNTILTTPLGITDEPKYKRKTVLGE